METGTPSFIAAGDFNGDGRLDIAAVSDSRNISVWFGSGNGTFRPGGKYGVGSSPSSIVSGDFNGDRALDVAVVNSDSNDVSVLLGDGNGSFAATTNYPLGPPTSIVGRTSIVSGDFNSDGRLDLAAVNGGTVGDSVSVLLGDGIVGFRNAVSYPAGATPGYVATGDFDRDGALDLAVVNRGVGAIGDNVAVLRGNGDGTFATAVPYVAGGNYADAVVVADFDGDQKLDLAVTSDLNVGILAGNGDGTFQNAVPFPLSGGAGGAHMLVSGDFDGDGKPDLAAFNRDTSVLRGRGDRSFDNEVRYAGGAFTPVLAIGDFDGDAKLDLVCGDNAGVRLLRGLGDGRFDAALIFGGRAPVAAAADFTGDGIVDLVELYTESVRTLAGRGDGTFAVPPGSPGAGPLELFFGVPAVEADLDGDGALDIARVDSDVRVWLGRGDGTFGPVAVVPASDTPGIFIKLVQGDFNGDGTPDLATGKPFLSGEGAGLLLGAGRGGFRPSIRYGAGGEFVTEGDFNGDGRIDVATLSMLGGVDVSLGNGDGSFLPAVIAPTVAGLGAAIVHGDFDGDGQLDLAIAADRGGAVLLGNGDGRFRDGIPFDDNRESVSALATADFDGDTRLDLVEVTPSGARVLLGTGNGAFTASGGRHAAGLAPFAVYAADFNRDGRPDVAVANAGGTVVLVNGCTSR